MLGGALSRSRCGSVQGVRDFKLFQSCLSMCALFCVSRVFREISVFPGGGGLNRRQNTSNQSKAHGALMMRRTRFFREQPIAGTTVSKHIGRAWNYGRKYLWTHRSRNYFWTHGSRSQFHATHVSSHGCATNVYKLLASRTDCATHVFRNGFATYESEDGCMIGRWLSG